MTDNIDNLSIEELAALAASTDDQTETTSGDFVREVNPAGPTVARFIEYVELGVHGQKPYKGKAKPDIDQVRMVFELNSPKHIKEIEVDGGKKTVANLQVLTLSLKKNDKSSYTKLLKAMIYGREKIVHMAQMLGEAFIITIEHNVVKGKDGNPDVTYANMFNEAKGWLISAPRVVDPITEVTTQVPVPVAINPKRIFLFANPNKPTWDSLFIDGTRTVKQADGTEKEESKNWLQNKIKSAKNFPGSPLDIMLNGVKTPSTDQAIAKEQAKVEEAKKDEPKNEVKEEAPFDPMAALGLTS